MRDLVSSVVGIDTGRDGDPVSRDGLLVGQSSIPVQKNVRMDGRPNLSYIIENLDQDAVFVLPRIKALTLKEASSFLSPNFRLPMIEGQPVNFPHQVLIVDCEIQALHVLLPIPMSHNGVGYKRMEAASHRVSLPAMPEIMNSGHWVELKAV